MNRIAVAGQFGEADHVLVADSLQMRLAHADREVFEAMGLKRSDAHRSPDEIVDDRGRPQSVACGELLEGGVIDRVRAADLVAMNAGGDEQRVDSLRERAGYVGAHRIADRDDAALVEALAAKGGRLRQRLLVDRR